MALPSKVKGLDCTQILPFLFLGSAKASKDAEGLKALGISHIVNLAGKSLYPDRFVYIQAHIKDSEDVRLVLFSVSGSSLILSQAELFPSLPLLCAQLDEIGAKGGRVLVHCLGGISRSPAVVVGYLMHRGRITYADALKLVREKRKAAHPNRNFEEQLKAWIPQAQEEREAKTNDD